MGNGADCSGLRLAELVAAVSLASDLGLGQPMEHLLRSCRLGLRLADSAGLSEDERAVVYYVALLGWVGCHAESHEQAAWFGDEIAMKADRYEVDMAGRAGASFVLRHVGAGGSPWRRARMLAPLIASHGKVAGAFEGTHCQLAGEVAVGLGLGTDVRAALHHVFERWDGKGRPAGLRGEQVALPARIVQLAGVVERHRREGGNDAAAEVARCRRGTQFDPALVDRLCREPGRMLSGLDAATSWDELIDAEPALRPVLSEEQLQRSLEAIADLADLKSPHMTGHSRGVAELVSAAAGRCGLLCRAGGPAPQRGVAARPRPAGSTERDLGQARTAVRGRVRAGAAVSVLHTADVLPVRAAGATGGDRRPASRAPRRLGLSTRA